MTAVATCALRRFDSEEAAAAAVAALVEPGRRGPNDCYACERCGGWHLRRRPSAGLTTDRAKQQEWTRRSAETAADRRADRLRDLAAVGELPEMARVSDRRMEREGEKLTRSGSTFGDSGRGAMAASKAQQTKTRTAGECRVIAALADVEPAEWPRDVRSALASWNGPMVLDSAHLACDHRCEDPDATVELVRPLHRAYDDRLLNLLPYLTLAEQVHAAREVGILRAIQRVTGHEWRPVDGTSNGHDRLPVLTYDEQAEVVQQLGGLEESLRRLSGVSWEMVPRELVA